MQRRCQLRVILNLSEFLMSESKPLLFSWVATRRVGICHFASRMQNCRGKLQGAHSADLRDCIAKDWKHMLTNAWFLVMHNLMLSGIEKVTNADAATREPVHLSSKERTGLKSRMPYEFSPTRTVWRKERVTGC